MPDAGAATNCATTIVSYAPLVTALIAACALIVACVSILIQKKIARSRAAIDFFLKTEMDEKMLKAYDDAQKGFRHIKAVSDYGPLIGTDEYKSIRNHLNIHELMAMAIHNKVFDEHVCYSFWSDELIRDWNAAKGLVAAIRLNPEEGTVDSYTDLEELAQSWIAKEVERNKKTLSQG